MWIDDSLPIRCHISSVMKGAIGASSSRNVSAPSRGTGAPALEKALSSSMSRAMAVLKLKVSKSSVTALTALWTDRCKSASSGAELTSDSTRHTLDSQEKATLPISSNPSVGKS